MFTSSKFGVPACTLYESTTVTASSAVSPEYSTIENFSPASDVSTCDTVYPLFIVSVVPSS